MAKILEGILLMRAYDFTPYEFTKQASGLHVMDTDDRHVDSLYAMAMKLPAGSRILEIGCFRGVSTSAFVQAINDGADLELFCVDPVVTPELRRVTELCRKNVVIHECQSTDVRISADMVFIDGHHEWPAIYEVADALALGAKVIATHDTKTVLNEKHADCWGSFLAWRILSEAKGRISAEDCEDRLGENTWRGFGVSVRSDYSEILEAAQKEWGH